MKQHCHSLLAKLLQAQTECHGVGTLSHMADVDMAVTSSRPRTIGPSTWLTRCGKSVWRSAHGPESTVLTRQTRRQTASTGRAPNLSLTFWRKKEGPCRKNARLGTRVRSTTRNLTTPSQPRRPRQSCRLQIVFRE
ncbi:hypothetical protein BHM03_00047368 [Ensete ventricosum]|nr:hypothetical protein BHM03_00047368 [Ensete ventricosum]